MDKKPEENNAILVHFNENEERKEERIKELNQENNCEVIQIYGYPKFQMIDIMRFNQMNSNS